MKTSPVDDEGGDANQADLIRHQSKFRLRGGLLHRRDNTARSAETLKKGVRAILNQFRCHSDKGSRTESADLD